MVTASFLSLIQRKAGGSANISDPLSAARNFLLTSGETAEGRALREVLRALSTGSGEFSESTLCLFGRERLQLIAALVEARLAAIYPQRDWDALR